MKLVTPLFLGMLLASTSVLANDWFVRAELGQSKSHTNVSKQLTAEMTLDHVDDSDVAYVFELGYQLNDDWALVGGWHDLGEASVSLSADTTNPDELHQAAVKISPTLAHGIVFATEYRLWHHDDFSVTTSVGVFAWEADFSSSLSDKTITHTEDGVDATLAVKLGYQLTQDWNLQLGYRSYLLSDRIDLFSAGISYHF